MNGEYFLVIFLFVFHAVSCDLMILSRNILILSDNSSYNQRHVLKSLLVNSSEFVLAPQSTE